MEYIRLMSSEGETTDLSQKSRLRRGLGEDSAWARLTAKYLRDLPRQLDGIRDILELRDYGKVKTHAHRIKGTSGTYRLETISRGAERLERLAESRNPDKIAAGINNVKQLVELEAARFSPAAIPQDSHERNQDG